MKRKPATAASLTSSTGNPSVVLRAFCPETCFTLSLDGWILLEALGCQFITGGVPGPRDIVMAILVMTDEDAVFEARRKGRFEELFRTATRGKRPGHILSLTGKIQDAIATAMLPADSGADSPEKKSSVAPVGG